MRRPPTPQEVDSVSDAESIQETPKSKKAAKAFDPSVITRDIEKLLDYSTFEPQHRYWLDTGSPELNAVLGSEEKGIPYGKQYEISGAEHGGKTALALVLGGMAQREGAIMGRIDLEDSRDPVWDQKLGVDTSQVINIYPKLVNVKPKKDKGSKKEEKQDLTIPVLQSAEMLFTEAEVAMARVAAKGYDKQFWFLDSIANIQTEMAIEAGNTDWNMRVGFDRALVLSRVLPRWAGLAANYNASIFLLNQLRIKGGVVFGDPFDSPGGKALRHNCAIRARVRRCKNGEIKRGNRVVGLVSVIKNIKNKAGGGSVQSMECGMRIYWRHDPAEIQFMSKEDAEALLKV